MSRHYFALLTDFGRDFAVASMEALLLQHVPDAYVVHIDHDIPKFSVVSGAFVLEQVYAYFPANTIFIGVVDPGVGSARKSLLITYQSYVFIGPDNGLFTSIIQQSGAQVYIIDTNVIVPASNTFHGRDLFVPAAYLYVQNKRDFLQPYAHPVLLSAQELTNSIVYIDSFGNIKTNIPWQPAWQGKIVRIQYNNMIYDARGVVTFADAQAGALIAYRGSNQTVEIACVQGSARKQLQAQVGAHITLTSKPQE